MRTVHIELDHVIKEYSTATEAAAEARWLRRGFEAGVSPEFALNGRSITFPKGQPLEGGSRELAAQLSVLVRRMHRAGICHRDVHADNVILFAYGPKLIDFEFACEAIEPCYDLHGPSKATQKPEPQPRPVWWYGPSDIDRVMVNRLGKVVPPTVIGIPVYNEWEMTADLVSQLVKDREYDDLVIVDNGSDDSATKRWLTQINGWANVQVWRRDKIVTTGRSLYASWNEVWDWALAKYSGPTNLILLNNDLRVPSGFIAHLVWGLRQNSRAWAAYPDARLKASEGARSRGVTLTHGLHVRGEGMSGYAFALKAEARHAGLPPIDEQFLWLCGDTDLILQIEKRGYQAARVEGLPVDHLGSISGQKQDWWAKQKRVDRRARREKYKESQ